MAGAEAGAEDRAEDRAETEAGREGTASEQEHMLSILTM